LVDHFQTSTVVIATQSITTTKEIIDKKSETLEQCGLEQAGMTLLPPLTKAMRTTSNIFELTETAIPLLEKNETTLPLLSIDQNETSIPSLSSNNTNTEIQLAESISKEIQHFEASITMKDEKRRNSNADTSAMYNDNKVSENINVHELGDPNS